MEKQFFTMSETSKYLGLSRNSIYRLIMSGELPSYKLSGRRMIKIDDLKEWAETRKDVR